MSSALLIRLVASSPWRIGPDSGARDRTARLLHSDALFSAVTHAFLQLGMLDAWLDATARSEHSAVRFTSAFPFQGDTLYVTPPQSLWPPKASSRVRWKGAHFVPLAVVEALAGGRPLQEGSWAVDADSKCLVAARNPQTPGPFRVAIRSNAAVDREGASVVTHSTACLEFTPTSGLWTLAQFADAAARDHWTAPLTAAFRLLADTGIGGERSCGWGRAEMPTITSGTTTSLLFRNAPRPANAYWLLSLFHPAATDQVDWSQGDYTLTTRSGRIESPVAAGNEKAATRMVAEGSVLIANAAPQGQAVNVAPTDFPHPIYRAGFAVAIPIATETSTEQPVPSDEEQLRSAV
jgi:CRISPR type III-A-associated RAMP protein Csm4